MFHMALNPAQPKSDCGRTDMADALAGKIAVVTGGTQGLGEAIARAYADNGVAGLVLCGRNEAKGSAVARDIVAKNSGSKTIFVRADLRHVADARAVIAAADKAFGR